MDELSFPKYEFKIRKTDHNEALILDEVRKKYVKLTPEEWVRQHVVKYLQSKGYPFSLMALEKEIKLFSTTKRFDILVHDQTGNPHLLVECKAPGVRISQSVFDQIARYNATLNVPFLVVTNGIKVYCLKYDGKSYEFLNDIPDYRLNETA